MFRELCVTENYNGYRLDQYLADNNAYTSRSLAAKQCKNNKVFINNVASSKNSIIKTNDIVKYKLVESENEIIGENIPLDIRYEDDHIIVLSKQPGLVCHPAHGHKTGTLVNALVNYCGASNLCNIQSDNNRLGIVHRLDADTSGLLICAKTDSSGFILSQAMKEHTTSRHYKALVCGNIKQSTGKIDVPLLRVLNKRLKMVASNDPKAKNAITSFEVLERLNTKYGQFTLLDCKIHTGRTHQIRSHMEYINHSVFGDPVYNKGAGDYVDTALELGLNRQFLHSYKIGFDHPITGKYLEFSDNIPSDLMNIYNILVSK